MLAPKAKVAVQVTIDGAERERSGTGCDAAAAIPGAALRGRGDGRRTTPALPGRVRTIAQAAAIVALLSGTFGHAPGAWAQSSIDERPNAFAMTGDLLVARPIGLVMTAVGTAAFVVSLPLTALAGSVAESAETLVLGPAETTFVRCLGCLEPGYSYKDVERRRLRREEKAEAEAGGR